MDPIYIRLIERLAIVIISGLCIFWGYRLFSIATQKQGEFKLGSDFLKVHLASVAPGIYFSLFGSLVLIFAIFSKVDFTYTTNGRDDGEKPSRQVSRGIASDSSAVRAYIDTNGLSVQSTEAVNGASGLIDLLRAFSDSEAAASLIDAKKLNGIKQKAMSSIADPFWSARFEAAETPAEILGVSRAFLSFVDLVERNEAEQDGARQPATSPESE
jgi:hypothetical protein